MEVYTGYGDKGMTDLSHTKNVSKSDDRICLMGSIEELVSHIGLVWLMMWMLSGCWRRFRRL